MGHKELNATEILALSLFLEGGEPIDKLQEYT